MFLVEPALNTNGIIATNEALKNTMRKAAKMFAAIKTKKVA